MRCAWKELLAILPISIRAEVDGIGRVSMQELRLRINAPPEVVLSGERRCLGGNVTQDDLHFVVNTASRYSPWCASTAAQGYITAPGGHRIGLCGTAVCKEGLMEGIREIDSICIRVARDYSGIAESIGKLHGSILILGAPGWGKTTLLRDLIRIRAEKETVSVVDERGELFPKGMKRGRQMDVLAGCPKGTGVDMLLRTMGPNSLALDEITAEGDCQALVHAANCGVHLLATAHAGSLEEFKRRPVYRSLWEQNIFDVLVILHKDKSYHCERMLT